MEKRYCPYCMAQLDDDGKCKQCGLTEGAYSPQEHHVPPGTVLAKRYLVGRVLGEGGFGITYIGRDLVLGLKIAIKEYFPIDKAARHSMASKDVSVYIGAETIYQNGKKRFLQEAQTMALMDKTPEIVSVRDFFEENNTAYIVMEYVEGTTLKELVKQRGGKIPPKELFDMIEPLFSALTSLHSKGLIHRDISPDNLMLENGKIRLIDFGCARIAITGDERTLTVAVKHGYAPIEQYNSHGQGPWTDVYALSATIYYCLTGMAPPRSPDRALEDELMIPSRLGIEISNQQEAALLKGMEFRPRLRTRTIEELYAALYKASPDDPPPPPPPLPPSPPPTPSSELKPWAKIAIIVVAALVIGFTVFWGSRGNGEESTSENPQDVPTIQENVEENSLDELLKLKESAFYCNDGNAQTLRRVMSNMETKALRLSGTLDVSDSSLTITKPVFVEAGAEFWVNNEVTVDSTTLYIEGHVAPECILRTVNGGRIVVADGGSLDNVGLLWLESMDDLVVLDGGYVAEHYRQEGEQLLVLNEDELSHGDGVYRVGNMVDWQIALDASWGTWDQGRDDDTRIVIIVEDDLVVEKFDYRVATAADAIIINEGVTITAAGETEGVFGLWEGGTLINHGTINAKLGLGGGDQNEHINAINYGRIHGVDWVDGTDVFLNYGEMTLNEAQYLTGTLYNFGTVNSDDDNEWLDLLMSVHNWGDFTVGGEIGFRGSRWFWNRGNLVVNEGANFNINATLVNSGVFDFAEGAQLYGDGILENYGIINYRNEEVDFGGILMEGRDAVSNVKGIKTLAHPMDHVYVDSYEGLLSAMNDDSISVVALPEMELPEALNLNKSAWLNAGLILKAGGDLTVSGGATILYADGYLDLNGQALNIQNGATLVVGMGIGNCKEINISDNSRLILYNGVEMQDGQFNIDESSTVTVLGYATISGGEMNLSGEFMNFDPLHLIDCTVNAKSGAIFNSDFGDFLLYSDSDLNIEEGAEVNIGGWGWQEVHLDSAIINRGFLGLHCVGTQVNGIIDNYGELTGIMSDVEMRDGQPYVETIDVYGSINNFGYMKGNFRVQDGGRISGNEIVDNRA